VAPHQGRLRARGTGGMTVRATYVVHIVAGSLGLIAGYVALYSAKGKAVHRRAGMAFVYAMLTMCAAGLTIAVVRGVAPAVNVPAALLTASFVATALTAVRPPSAVTRAVERAATLASLGVAVASLTFASQALANGGTRDGMPAFPFLLFGVASALAVAGDARMMREGTLRGARRLARHLWRMSFALLVAALSFFIGQAKVIPKPIRILPLLGLPVLAVLVTMLWWLWRVRLAPVRRRRQAARRLAQFQVSPRS
jgi:hypothetical protein